MSRKGANLAIKVPIHKTLTSIQRPNPSLTTITMLGLLLPTLSSCFLLLTDFLETIKVVQETTWEVQEVIAPTLDSLFFSSLQLLSPQQ